MNQSRIIAAARNVRCTSGNGASWMAKESYIQALSRMVTPDLSVFTTQAEISKQARLSPKQVSRVQAELMRSGEVYAKHQYEYSQALAKRIRVGTVITLRCLVGRLKSGISTLFHLKDNMSSQMYYSQPATLIQTVVNNFTGELLHESTREVRCRPTEKEVLRRGAL